VEQRTISAGEERFERVRQTSGLILGPLVFVALWLLPLGGLTVSAHRLAAIMGLVIVFWLTESIPIAVTAILGPVLCIVLGVATAKEVLPNFGHPLILLFLGSFIIAKAMRVHGVSQRFALTILAQPFIASSPYRVLFALGAVTAVLSMWISNTATTAMMYPIGLGVLGALAAPPQSGQITGPTTAELARTRFGTGLMLLVAYSASIGGIATPVGSPPNLIALGALDKLTDTRISFFPVDGVRPADRRGVVRHLVPVPLAGVSTGVHQPRQHRRVRRRRTTPARTLVARPAQHRRGVPGDGLVVGHAGSRGAGLGRRVGRGQVV